MKRIKIATITLIGILGFGGCASTGFQRSQGNGKVYWVPEKCERTKTDSNNRDKLWCLHDGEPTGVYLMPADYKDIDMYNKENETDTKALNELNKSLQNYNNKQLQQNYNTQQYMYQNNIGNIK